MYIKNDLGTIRQCLDTKKITPQALFSEANALAHEYQNMYNSFVTIIDEPIIEKHDQTIVTDIPYALKDNISTSGIKTTASSNILKNYIPVYDATVYKKLKSAGAVLLGKTVLDELAMGGTGTTGHTGITRNPWDPQRIIGGSSAGSAAAVALGIVPFAIGSDTGDSVRKPAAFGGVVGFKPTYGRISRYGLFAFTSSMDHIGIFTRNVKDSAYITDILKGHDEYDMTSLIDDQVNYIDHLSDDIKGRKLFYFKDVCDINNYDVKTPELQQTLDNFKVTVEKCKKLGFIVEGISFDKKLLNALYPTYMTISCAEATSNNANLTGIAFGERGIGQNPTDIIFDARTKGFSELIKRRFILGSYILQRENQERLFLNAGRIRHIVVDKMNKLFENYDGLIMPSSGGIAPMIGSKTDQLSDSYLILENHLVIANFGGYPSISIPSGFIDNMPIGINITGRNFDDALVLNMAHYIERELGFKNIIASGGDLNV